MTGPEGQGGDDQVKVFKLIYTYSLVSRPDNETQVYILQIESQGVKLSTLNVRFDK